MPTRRTRVAHARFVLGPIEREHLQLGGDHLLAGAEECWICQRGIESARAIWQEHREDILAGWRHGFPCFAQIVFEGAALPTAHDRERSIIAAMIADAVAALKP